MFRLERQRLTRGCQVIYGEIALDAIKHGISDLEIFISRIAADRHNTAHACCPRGAHTDIAVFYHDTPAVMLSVGANLS
jgi:hypothetical protein